MRLSKQFIFLSVVVFLLSFLPGPSPQAAWLHLAPAEGEYYEQDIFLIELRLDTQEESINAVQADLTFPPEFLSVLDISKGKSIFSLWPVRPEYCNEKGTISLIAGQPTGFVGRGSLATIPFQVKETETGEKYVASALIEFQDTSLALLNDGLGTPAELKLEPARLTVWPEKRDIPLDEWRESLIKDDRPPEPFEIIIARDRLIFDGQHFIFFKSIDSATGIDYYEIREGDSDWQRGESPYLLQDQTLQSLIQVKAVDKAGNERIEEIRLPVLPVPFYKNIIFIFLIILIPVLIIIYLFFNRQRKINYLKKKP